MAKKSKEKWKVYNNVFDEFTLRTLFKLSTQGHFDELQSPVSIGKEANIFTAKKGEKRIIVKIYRLETCDFNKMYTYIKTDPRFINLKKQKRKIIFAWTQREFRNLMKAREAGVRVPIPIAFLNNVLLLELIGDPAPQMKDLIPKNKKKFFDTIIKYMRKLYKANLVHGDLSGFNILNDNEKPVFIDFSQSTSLKDPNVTEYLIRDIKNIAVFFTKIGLKVDREEIKQNILK